MTSQPPPKPPEEITKEQALEIAGKAIYELKPDAEHTIEEEKTVEKEFGWVFFYSPKKYLETRDVRDLIPGGGPLVVERLGGGTQFLPTSLPPEKAIEEYEKRWLEAEKAKH